jgi:myo-inositol-1(or 4)-monophosphatase
MSDIKIRQQIAQKAALAAGEFLDLQIKNLDVVKFDLKSKNDVVTEMDRMSEKVIIDIIHSALPQDDILSEECGELKFGGDGRWIIDPIDGTENYIRGYSEYAVSIGYEQEKGKPIIGVVFCPARREIYYAGQGLGAFIGEKPIRVSNKSNPSEAITLISPPFRLHEYAKKYFELTNNIFLESRDVRNTGSAALHMCFVAAGLAEGYLEFGVYPYDIAAGLAIVQEAGGKWSSIGSSKHPFETDSIIATNGIMQEWYFKHAEKVLDKYK